MSKDYKITKIISILAISLALINILVDKYNYCLNIGKIINLEYKSNLLGVCFLKYKDRWITPDNLIAEKLVKSLK